VLFALATAATIWARIALGTMWSSTPVARENHGLRTTGPYAITRHPIYTGVLAMLAGTAVMQGSGRWVALFALVLGVLLLKIRSEERLLEHELGAAYTRYRRRVPRLLPDPRRSRRR
jgi:protein-S-isoprenylcysteine O-methyltransferase Ste14